MARGCIALVASFGRETDEAGRVAAAAQASIDAFFDGESSIFSLERCAADEEQAPESGSQSTAMPLAPAA